MPQARAGINRFHAHRVDAQAHQIIAAPVWPLAKRSLLLATYILIGTLRAFDAPPLRLMTPGDPDDRTLPACIRASLDRDRQNTLAPAAYVAQY